MVQVAVTRACGRGMGPRAFPDYPLTGMGTGGAAVRERSLALPTRVLAPSTHGARLWTGGVELTCSGGEGTGPHGGGANSDGLSPAGW